MGLFLCAFSAKKQSTISNQKGKNKMNGKNTKAHSLRKSGKKNRRKEIKREEAISRQNYYNSLSTDQKISLAKSRRGNSDREITKLQKVVE